MNIQERFKKFPIKFYKNIKTDNIEYESGFTQGTSKTLQDAFKIFDTEEFVRDLYYYYDDVVDIRYGQFIPALNDKVRKGRMYLGMLELELDIQKPYIDSKQTVSYLNRHRDEIPNHIKYIKDMKSAENKDKIKSKVSNIFKRIFNYIKGNNMQEMFFPLKTSGQLICKHCGKAIPIGTYYEEYRGQDYHIECLWDKIINKMPENPYQEAEKFFFSLEKFVGDWPAYGYDVEEDYLSDLELVKHNNRILNREAMTEDTVRLIQTLEYYNETI